MRIDLNLSEVRAELRAAGADGLVITGRAVQSVYLYVHDGTDEIRDASA